MQESRVSHAIESLGTTETWILVSALEQLRDTYPQLYKQKTSFFRSMFSVLLWEEVSYLVDGEAC